MKTVKSEPEPSAPMRLSARDLASVAGFGSTAQAGGEAFALPDGHLGFGVVDIFDDAVDEVFKRVGTAGVEEAAAVAIGVEVGDGVLLQFVGVEFCPLG